MFQSAAEDGVPKGYASREPSLSNQGETVKWTWLSALWRLLITIIWNLLIPHPCCRMHHLASLCFTQICTLQRILPPETRDGFPRDLRAAGRGGDEWASQAEKGLAGYVEGLAPQ